MLVFMIFQLCTASPQTPNKPFCGEMKIPYGSMAVCESRLPFFNNESTAFKRMWIGESAVSQTAIKEPAVCKEQK